MDKKENKTNETDKITISKPVTVAQDELTKAIITSINESNLHPALIMPVMTEIYEMVKELLRQTKEKEKAEYEKSIQENESNESNESK
jgi:hypothetical protein